MSWLSKEDKSELTKQGLVFFGNIMKEQIENSKSEKAKFIEAKKTELQLKNITNYMMITIIFQA